MTEITANLAINWRCKHTWKTASYNTAWCLLGCAIGDLGTIAYFQFMAIAWPVWAIMSLAILNGLMTSIILETIILSRQMPLKLAFKTADWYVIDFHDRYGNRNECHRRYIDGRRHSYLVGYPYYASSRFYYATTL